MIRNIYTLEHVVKELKKYIGFEVLQVFSQEKDSVTLELSNGEEDKHLHFAADGKNDALFLRNNFARSKSNSSDLFPMLSGEVLQNASIIDI